jgi:hypothetical protein
VLWQNRAARRYYAAQGPTLAGEGALSGASKDGGWRCQGWADDADGAEGLR